MSDSVYKFITVVGTSTVSWEDAAKCAVEKASKTLRDVRVAEIKEMDMKMEEGNVIVYRAKINLSFRIEKEDEMLFHKDPECWNLEKEHPFF
jgi:dodecin